MSEDAERASATMAELRNLIGAIEKTESEADELEAKGGPRRLGRAATHREHARLWRLRAIDLLTPQHNDGTQT